MSISRLLVLLAVLALAAGSASAKRPPNIVFFFIDDLGWSDLGCYGSKYHLTPNIDALAASGMRFTDAYAACPVCSPTRASIMTGKLPPRSGITDWIGAPRARQQLVTPANVAALQQDEVTFAEVLKQAGYKTAYFGKWHLGKGDADLPTTQGFDHIRGVNRGGAPGSYHYPFFRPKKRGIHDVPDFEHVPKDSYLTDVLAAEAASFVDTAKDGPFLLMLAHYAIHTPIQPRDDEEKRFEERREELGLPVEPAHQPEKYGATRITQNNPGLAAMVASVDSSVGLLLGKLVEHSLEDNTLVIFTSDNGGLSTLPKGRKPPGSCLPLRAGKGWLYEGGIRVPAIVRWPGVTKAGSESAATIISSDFYPTILGAAGLPMRPKQHLDGIDLTAVLRGGELAPRSLYWHYPHYHGSANRPSAAIRMGQYKLVRWYEDGSEELYDLDKDLSESEDLSAKDPARRARLAENLDSWLEDVGARMPQPNPDRAPAR